ncbi:hypothetical protein [Sansalvadorimonas verongulae]|uniref:hypothetical protein n=1 Tax=Sansalvadorimonas verongulae TaxID=2172824 RepID=UPI0012BC957F|nr:hypothetical protein [Sansalvadorimonas verongulae]MTI15014.1 hypothetical protein [Sansalvadorimonas verongulae]
MATNYRPLPLTPGLSLLMPLTRREELEARHAPAVLTTPAIKHLVPRPPRTPVGERQTRMLTPDTPLITVSTQTPPSVNVAPRHQPEERQPSEKESVQPKGKKRKILRGRERSLQAPKSMPVERITQSASQDHPSTSGAQLIWDHKHLTNTAITHLRHQLEHLICSKTRTFPKALVSLRCGHVFDQKFHRKNLEPVTCSQTGCGRTFSPLEVALISQPQKIRRIAEEFLSPLFPEGTDNWEFNKAAQIFSVTLSRFLTPEVPKLKEACDKAIHDAIQAAVRTLPTYGLSDILIPPSDQGSSDEGELFEIPPLRKRPVPALKKTGAEPAKKSERPLRAQQKAPPFVVQSKLKSHWKPFDGTAGRYCLTHVIVPTKNIDQLTGDHRWQEVFPKNFIGENLARRVKQAAENNIRFILQKQPDGRQTFTFNPDLPAMSPDTLTVPKNHWCILREQLDRYGVELDDNAL